MVRAVGQDAGLVRAQFEEIRAMMLDDSPRVHKQFMHTYIRAGAVGQAAGLVGGRRRVQGSVQGSGRAAERRKVGDKCFLLTAGHVWLTKTNRPPPPAPPKAGWVSVFAIGMATERTATTRLKGLPAAPKAGWVRI